MARTIFPLDEINSFKERLTSHLNEDGRIRSREDVEDIIDELLDLFLLAYANGVEVVNEQFGGDFSPSPNDVEETIYMPIDGETWEDRVWHWFDEGGTAEDIVRIAETEAHRDGNTAAHTTAVKAGAKTKRWECMMLPTSRDTHMYLNGVTIPIDAEFYTYNGNHAMFPGQFGVAEEDVNCMCICQYR